MIMARRQDIVEFARKGGELLRRGGEDKESKGSWYVVPGMRGYCSLGK